jgi:haloalkane dehalogenase
MTSSGSLERPIPALGLTRRVLELDGARVSYIDEGSGPVVLLLHGAPLTSLGFLRVIRALRADHRVIAPDLPGFGGSELPSGFTVRLAACAAFVESFCVALGLRGIHVYVNDASGSFGLAAAARLGDRVAGVIVADTVQIPLTGWAWPVRQILTHVLGSRLVRWLNRRLNLFPWLVATLAPYLRPFSREERVALVQEFDTAEKRDRVLDLFEQMGRDVAFMRETAALVSERLRDRPALLLYGQLDPVRLLGAPGRFRRLLPRSVVRVIAREEHFPILASGERVAEIVRRWISALAAALLVTAGHPPTVRAAPPPPIAVQPGSTAARPAARAHRRRYPGGAVRPHRIHAHLGEAP